MHVYYIETVDSEMFEAEYGVIQVVRYQLFDYFYFSSHYDKSKSAQN